MPDNNAQRDWYVANREITIARSREYAKANPDRVRAAKRRYQESMTEDMRERKRARRRAHYAENRERVLEAGRVRYAANRERELERHRKYRAANQPNIKAVGLKYRFGITIEQWQTLLDAQGGKCKICGTSDPGGKLKWHTDHCHNSNTIRGILCHRCNVGVGHFKDNPELLRRAAEYLENSPTGDAA